MYMTDSDIIKCCYDKRGYINSRIIQEIEKNNDYYCQIKDYLDNRFSDSNNSSYREIITRIKYNIEEIPKCPVCGSKLHFVGKKNKIYTDSCSIQCIMLNKTVKDKIKQTNLKKYGVEHNWQLSAEQQKSHSIESLNKCFETQKKNGTLNKSKIEDESFELLKSKYPDIIRHYKDKNRYPFACDFYIPSLDLFIECQYSMFHNNRPYLNTENDKNEIETIKQKSENLKQITGKNKTRYDALIETWTIRDVKKREMAKQNNLNYLEFWNINELKEWIKNYELA